jgi:hypothetical protein
LRYVKARINDEVEQKAYRIYVSDALKYVTENTSRSHGGTTLSRRYIDIIDKTPEDERTADEIISSIRKKLKELEG